MSDARTQRCAIYTRVSTEHGLEQEFNSLDAQREACSAYVKSQVGGGWRLLPALYDDGGYSGGSMERPALTRLLADIREGAIDIIVVYKVDRLTRSLADFAKLVEIFDRHGVSFVSVTQSFNTTSSMGRLTLNVLLSFAQFEREVTGERIRDKIAASKKKGLRVGGPVPLGYRVKDKKLIIEPTEAETVRMIFRRYLDLGSLTALVLDLSQEGARTKSTLRRDGSIRGNVPFRKGALAYLLHNRVYVGDVAHKGKHYRGEHEPIVPSELFKTVQQRLTEQARNAGGIRVNTASPLTGRLFDDRGNRMTPATTNKNGVRYRYYISSALAEGRRHEVGLVSRVPAAELEEAVRSALAGREGQDPDDTAAENPLSDKEDLVLVTRVVVRKGDLEITLTEKGTNEPDVLIVPWAPSQFPRRRELVAEAGGGEVRPIRSETRARLVEGIAMARSWVDELVSGRATSSREIAKREGLSERSVRTTLNLAFLSPMIIKAAVAGTLSREAGICRLTETNFAWEAQVGLIRTLCERTSKTDPSVVR